MPPSPSQEAVGWPVLLAYLSHPNPLPAYSELPMFHWHSEHHGAADTSYPSSLETCMVSLTEAFLHTELPALSIWQGSLRQIPCLTCHHSWH